MAWQDQSKKTGKTTSYLYLVFANYLSHDSTAASFLIHRHPWPSLGTSTICSQTTARIGRCCDVSAHHCHAPIDGWVAARWRWCSTGFGHVCGCGQPSWVAVLLCEQLSLNFETKGGTNALCRQPHLKTRKTHSATARRT